VRLSDLLGQADGRLLCSLRWESPIDFEIEKSIGTGQIGHAAAANRRSILSLVCSPHRHFTGTTAMISQSEGKQQRIGGAVAFPQREIYDSREFRQKQDFL
jgi:hypothetical protein